METQQQVTRFYGTVCYAMDVIKNSQIAFVHCSKMNDPFAPYCFVRTDFGGSYQNLIAHVTKNHPLDMPWFGEHVTPQSWERTLEKLEAYLQSVKAAHFMLSTSAAHSGFHPKDNLYMWSHYADGHRGLAIEFNTRALTRAVLKHSEAQNNPPYRERDVWAKIEYAKTVSPITAEHVYEFVMQGVGRLKRK